MLAHKFCIPPSAIQQQELQTEVKKIFLQNWTCFCFIIQKFKDPVSSLCHMKKKTCVVLNPPKH